ncbi:hypothetical protein [Pseudomonas sp. 008]|uniref:hypothetical protein n=1 Tax=Pseudomonas sp. 008 TaxID=2803906 RepID=UPI00195126C9|nr:hypothetical protein [Pseudomonas sp. 008]GID06828.1 hypothetical protein TMM008_40300 [Pseudomonas sp. 008]
MAEVFSEQDDAQRYTLYVYSVLGAIAQIPQNCDRLLEAIALVEEGVLASTSMLLLVVCSSKNLRRAWAMQPISVTPSSKLAL